MLSSFKYDDLGAMDYCYKINKTATKLSQFSATIPYIESENQTRFSRF